MKILQVLAVAVCLAVAGCGPKQWDIESVKSGAREHFNQEISKKGGAGSVSDVQLIRTDSPNIFKGEVKYSDGTSSSLTITIDPQTGKPFYEFAPN